MEGATAAENAAMANARASPSLMSKMAKSVRKYLPRHNKNDVEKNYKIGKELGSGNFAVVKVAIKRDTAKRYAVKIINKALCSGKEDMIETEINILKKVDHPHVVGMYEEFDTPDKLYLILDYVDGGELFDRIVDEGNFTEADASRITRQMTEAIQYLHSHGVVHRDLKPENILFKDRHNTNHVLLTDFGLAKLLDDETALKTACGTPNYVAPEILMQKGYGKHVDIWSLGVILYILLCGYPPFYDESDAVLFEMIMKGKFEFDDRFWHDVSKEAKNLISNMLIVDPVRRFTTKQILEHTWITGKAKLPAVNLSKSISMHLGKTFGRAASQEAAPSRQPAAARHQHGSHRPARTQGHTSRSAAARARTEKIQQSGVEPTML